MATPGKRNAVVLRAVHPNEGIRAEYRRRLDRLIDEMNRSIQFWIEQAYKRETPEIQIAMDASPAAALQAMMRKLGRRWLARFKVGAKELAAWFAQAAHKRSDAVLKAILKKAGISVEWHMTKAMNDIVQATVHQNVNLIKSIPAQYLKNVETIVMQSVQTGRDLGQLSKDLQAQFGVTKRRAALIARTQNNMATAALTRARQVELGIDEAVWVHSGAGKHPRPTHVKAGKDKVRYKISEGWWDPHEKKHILPGQLINCRCIGRPVIEGFS